MTKPKLPCRAPDVDPELWFPIGKTGPALDTRAKAMTACDACPILAECLARAIVLRVTDGIWGGMDFAPERAHLPNSGHRFRRELEEEAERAAQAAQEAENALQDV